MYYPWYNFLVMNAWQILNDHSIFADLRNSEIAPENHYDGGARQYNDVVLKCIKLYNLLLINSGKFW